MLHQSQTLQLYSTCSNVQYHQNMTYILEQAMHVQNHKNWDAEILINGRGEVILADLHETRYEGQF